MANMKVPSRLWKSMTSSTVEWSAINMKRSVQSPSPSIIMTPVQLRTYDANPTFCRKNKRASLSGLFPCAPLPDNGREVSEML